MDDRSHRYATTSSVLAWTSHTAKLEPSIEEEIGDTDEPPDSYATMSPLSEQFRRTSLRRGSEQHESLLTKALQSHSDDDLSETTSVVNRRRRSMTSNTSFASTTDMTCDTGISTPARTSTPSPRLVDGPFMHHGHKAAKQPAVPATAAAVAQKSGEKDPAVQALEKKRCISFACAAKPNTDAKPHPPKVEVTVSKPAEPAPQRRTCIRFACPTQKPAKVTPPEHAEQIETTPINAPSHKKEFPSTAIKHRSPSAFRLSRPSMSARRTSNSPIAVRTSKKKWLTADSRDLESECSRYHAFASEEVEEDDWIRRDQRSGSGRITIDDTLKKENAIRKLGEEVEEEEEMEEQLEDEADNEDDADDGNGDDVEDEDADEDGDEEDLDDDQTVDGSEADGGSDGYNTDNEVGFAESEEDDDELDLWTTGLAVTHMSFSGATPVRRRSSFAGEMHSDSSIYGGNKRRTRAKRVPRADTPELPDSTDFVCGTLDEDKPLEEAYVSRIAARRKEKLHPIPQDIDPSFPTSEPEDEAEQLFKHGHHGSNDEVFGDMEDVSDGPARKDRRHKNASPTRYHSPPPKRHGSPAPKRHHSPAPKVRGRSPRCLFDGHSPRRLRSPPPQLSRSPAASPILAGQGINFKHLATRPGLVFTKSLPRTPAVFGPLKGRRGRSGTITQENHIRGAIDIVKGLEQKRQRRKEKFYQKYCTRARKNPAQTKRPAPGQGAQRMREVGLTMAGKLGQSNFVLSV